jgi:hypothetical protein
MLKIEMSICGAFDQAYALTQFYFAIPPIVQSLQGITFP